MYIPLSDDEHRFVQKVHPARANSHWEPDVIVTPGADPGFYQGGGAQIVTGLNCQRCAAASCERSEPFSVRGLGPALGPQKLLGIFITKYAFSPFWGTFLYYF